MTKKILFILALPLAMMVSCNNNQAPVDSVEVTAGGKVNDITIAYVNTDSLISSYTFYIESRDKFQAKQKKVGAELDSRGRSIDGKMSDLQNKMQKGLVTRAQAEEMGVTIEKDQQNFMAYRNKMLTELGEEEQVMLNNVLNNISEYIKKYNKDNKFSLILSKSAVLNDNSDFDITNEIIEGINKEYSANTTK